MERSKQIEECIQHCIKCFQGCTEGIPHCLDKGGKHAEPSHIKLMMETADMCNINASFLLQEAKHAKEHCKLCATVCEDCSEACGSFSDDSKMKMMSENLKKCADSCRNM